MVIVGPSSRSDKTSGNDIMITCHSFEVLKPTRNGKWKKEIQQQDDIQI